MQRSADAVLERTKVREVTGVFHSHAALEDAASALLLAGFDRADVDRIASLEEMYRRLGAVVVAPEELPDVPQAPRQPVIGRDDITTTNVAIGSTVAAFAAMLGALMVVASGGGVGLALTVAIAAAIIAGGLAFYGAARMTGRDRRHQALQPLEESRGLILWARVRKPEQEEQAVEMMRAHGGRAVRVHVIEVAKTVEDIPLSSLRPDPWLGPERLGHP